MDYKIISGDFRISEMQKNLGQRVWPEFMQHDFIVNRNWPALYKDFLKFQFALFTGRTIIGIGNSVPLNWQKPFADLPDTGLDWAMSEALKNLNTGVKPNLLIGVQILINPRYRKLGISQEMLRIMKEMAKLNEISYVAIPVRPTLKCRYPLIPMEEYVNWHNHKNLPFDPWIRVHIKAGGRLTGICKRSMVISGSVDEWQKWSGLEMPESGEYVVDNALTPVTIDTGNNVGTYIEPNVWIVHESK